MYKYRTQYPDFSQMKILFSNRKQNEKILPVFRKSPNFSLSNAVLLNISENLVKFINQLTNNHTTKMSQYPIETNGNLHVFSIWYGESC